MKNQEIKDYLTSNTDYLYGNYQEVADKFKVHYDVVRKMARSLRDVTVSQKVVGPSNYEGKFKSGKFWQLSNGEWRESIQYQADTAAEWNKFKNDFINELKKLAPESPKLPQSKGDHLYEISLPDLHFGKGNVDELIERFEHSVEELLLKGAVYNIKKVLLPIGNDGLNSEGKRQSTTAGTPQKDSLHWQESFRIYWTCLVRVIERISKIYPVDVLIVTGNHDEERMFYIGDVLLAYFSNNINIRINNNGEYRKYYEYGVNMLLFTHGDKEKVSELPLIMATEQPEMFARTKYREVHLGHLHKEMSNEFRGIKVKFLPSICTVDEWHKMMGYESLKCAQGFMYHEKGGLQATYQINHFD